jgi:hypothetical protein
MWSVEHFLNQRRRELDTKYDYRYSRLASVFGREGELEGLSQDKLESIQRVAAL